MPSGYAVGRTDAESPGGGFLLQGFAVCVERLEDEAAVDCGPRAIPNLSALSPKQFSLFTVERHIEREVSLGEQTSVLACMKSILLLAGCLDPLGCLPFA